MNPHSGNQETGTNWLATFRISGTMNGIAGVSTMAWIYLFIAAICEVSWPVGMKLAAVHPAWRIVWILFAAIPMTLSGIFLYLAQRHIPQAR